MSLIFRAKLRTNEPRRNFTGSYIKKACIQTERGGGRGMREWAERQTHSEREIETEGGDREDSKLEESERDAE